MTYKEKIAKIQKVLEPTEWGGVIGCPGTYFPDAPIFGSTGRRSCPYNVPSPEHCTNCWNTEMPEQKKSEPKKAETPMDLIVKALESNDKSVHLRTDPNGTISIDIVPVGAFKETEDEPVSKLGQLNEQEAKEAIRFLQSKFKLGPEQNVVKHGYWREIKYRTDENGKRSLVEDGLIAYKIFNVYCPEASKVYAAFWSDTKSAWVIAGTTSACNSVILPFEPTHWMPVPKAPKEG